MDAYPWTEYHILIWVSIYWISSASIAARLRIYYKALNGTQLGRDRKEKRIPHLKLVLAHFPQERSVVPKCWDEPWAHWCMRAKMRAVDTS